MDIRDDEKKSSDDQKEELLIEVNKSELKKDCDTEAPLKQLSRYVALIGFGCGLLLCLQGNIATGLSVILLGFTSLISVSI